ncbi:MAG: hypothetical protein KME10_23495 [Plectolyngbya sp. WJT66-NPBG17]|jgi:hypothetical protein|nr:hypothetical protein [Plectolyngbya sp. WJT66-NPBG17]
MQRSDPARLNRSHVAWCVVVGVLGVFCAVGSLSPDRKSTPNLFAAWFAALISGAAFGCVIVLSQEVEKAELIEERFRQQDEDAAFLQRQAVTQAKVQRLQLHEGAKLQVDELIAEDEARNYYAAHLGVDPADIYEAEVDDSQEVEYEEAAPKAESKPVESAPVVQPAPVQPVQVQPTPIVAQPGICQALDEIVVTDISTVFASATGTGKSVSEAYILDRLFARHPQIKAWVVAQKNDSFCRLREKGRTSVFDPVEPLESLGAIDEVYEIFNKRRQLPESARSGFKNQPVRLILSDWHSIWDTVKDEKWYKAKQSKKLSTLVTVGREMNVCLIVDTQSYNVASLGITEDANIRSNLNILCQGYSWIDEEGRQRGDWNMITNLLKNRYLVPTNRDRLLQDLEHLKTKSNEQRTPVIFSSIGNKLQLLPDLTAFKSQK